MAINTSLLVAAPILQDYFVDKDTGLPLSNGTVTLYFDSDHSTFKNWFYQTGVFGSYTYTELQNPLTLSAVGTIQDGSGNDVIPFFYPYSEVDNSTSQAYYVVVKDEDGETQFTRANFPFIPPTSANIGNQTLKNYIVNNGFWRSNASYTLNSITATTPQLIAPSNHDSFAYPDIQYFQDVSGGVTTATLNAFSPGQFLSSTNKNDVTPDYYLKIACTDPGTQTYKYVQFPVALHIKTLEQVQASFPIYGRCNSGATDIVIKVFQHAGSGSSTSVTTSLQTITLTSNFVKTTVSFTFPASSGITLSTTGDDALYVQIWYPTGAAFDIDIAKPSLYLGNEVAGNDFESFDQANSIINSPRTGDHRLSPILGPNGSSGVTFGWLLCADYTIGQAGSGAGFVSQSVGQSAWPLFNFLWPVLKNLYENVSQTWAQILTSAGAGSTYGASAYADFIALKRLPLTRILGRVLAGQGLPSSGTNTGTSWAAGQITGNELAALSSAAQLPSHTHTSGSLSGTITATAHVPSNADAQGAATVSAIGNASSPSTTIPIVFDSGLCTVTGGATGATGSSSTFNIQDPVTYLNVFLKL